MSIQKKIKLPQPDNALTEEGEQLHLCAWIKETYPHIIFWSDLSGFNLPIGLAMKAKAMRSGRGVPDLFLAFPCGGYHGLFIELKKTGTKKKNNEHFIEQEKMLMALELLGYRATFAFGLEEAKIIISQYISL